MPSTGKITSADEIAFTRKVDDFGTADLDEVAAFEQEKREKRETQDQKPKDPKTQRLTTDD